MNWRIVISSLIFVAATAATSAYAGEVKVYALGDEKATLRVNRAKPKLFRPGDSPAPGLKLIKATSKYAMLDVNGSRLKLALGELANFRAAP